MHENVAPCTACGGVGVCDGGSTCVQEPGGMACIPSGTFWMGCNSSKDTTCNVEESPQHKVTLSSYWMDVSEVTTADWKACMDGGGCTAPGGDSTSNYCNWDTAGVKAKTGREQFPVNCVDWAQSQAYCKWRGTAYDLPTEAQWEMAARGDCVKNGKTSSDPTCAQAMRTYPWGEATATCSYAVMHSGTGGCGMNATWAVGSKAAGDSPYGLHDMAGNVFEWNRDWYDANYYAASSMSDPTGPGSGGSRGIRGGGFDYDAVTVFRSSFRSGYNPAYGYFSLGLRCSRTLP